MNKLGIWFSLYTGQRINYKLVMVNIDPIYLAYIQSLSKLIA